MEMKNIDWRPGPPMPSVCRCCLAEGCYKDISTEYFWMGKREVYSEMLSDTFDVSISYSTSAGPNSNSRLICELCISRLRDASEFKKQVFECEKTFKQHLDPGRIIVEIEPETVDKDVKLEDVKLEKKLSDVDDNIDDIFDADVGFSRDDDDDDDDMDNQPLVALASKKPKKESVDVQELLDSTVSHLKRKSGSKDKSSPRKKTKTSKLVAKTATTKTVAAEKKKKDDAVKRNTRIIIKHTTAYPFRVNSNKTILCSYCGDLFEHSKDFRKHMCDEHETFSINMVFEKLPKSDDIKVDVTDFKCRLCNVKLKCVDDAGEHLKMVHDKQIETDASLGLMPFLLGDDNWTCAICGSNQPSLLHLNKHTMAHYTLHVCAVCGKSYAKLTALKQHLKFKHTNDTVFCTRCRKRFATVKEKFEHQKTEKQCMLHCCSLCPDRFPTWDAKQRHMTNKHSVSEAPSYNCQECDMSCASRRAFYDHFKRYHSQDFLICTQCGLRFSTNVQLNKHIGKKHARLLL